MTHLVEIKEDSGIKHWASVSACGKDIDGLNKFTDDKITSKIEAVNCKLCKAAFNAKRINTELRTYDDTI